MDSVIFIWQSFFINDKFDKEKKFYIIYLDNMMEYLDIF